MRTLSQRRARRFLTAAILLVAAGCSVVPQPPAGTVVCQLRGNPEHLDPLHIGSALPEKAIQSLVYDELFATRLDGTVGFDAALAERAELSADRRTLTVELHADRRWHDGAPVTADDVVLGFALARDPDISEQLRLSVSPEIESVESAGERTVRIVFRHPVTDWVHAADIWPVPSHLVAPELDAARRTGTPWMASASGASAFAVGTGPYRVIRHTEKEVVLERWDGYAGPPVRIARFVFRVVPNAETALNAFLAGQLDLVRLTGEQLGGGDLERRLGPRGRIASVEALATDIVLYNLRRPPFDDRRVRRALAAAIDREAIVEHLLGGRARIASGWFPPEASGVSAGTAPIAHDPAAAAALLREAGWSRGEDGSWVRAGRPLAFTLLHMTSALSTEIAGVIEDDLRRFGVSVELQPLEQASLIDRLRRRAFDAALLSYTLPSRPALSEAIWHSRGAASGSNLAGLTDETIDRLFEQVRSETDPGRAGELLRRIDARLAELQPALFLWHPRRAWAISHRLAGVELSPRGPFAFRPGARAWRLDDDGTH